MPQTSPTRIFLVIRLDAEPDVVPENAQIVRADCVETLQNAQAIKTQVEQFVQDRKVPIGTFKTILRQLIQ